MKKLRKYPTIEEEAEARKLYTQGFSIRRVGELLNLSAGAIERICQDIMRTKAEALRLRENKKTSHWRSMRNRSRKLVEYVIGRKLTRFEHVHHIDGDYTNNTLINLQLLSAEEHGKLHHPGGPEYGVPRHQRVGRREYMERWFASHPGYRTEYSRKRRARLREKT